MQFCKFRLFGLSCTWGLGESWCRANASTLAVTPVPHVVTSACFRSTPAVWNTACISSGPFSLSCTHSAPYQVADTVANCLVTLYSSAAVTIRCEVCLSSEALKSLRALLSFAHKTYHHYVSMCEGCKTPLSAYTMAGAFGRFTGTGVKEFKLCAFLLQCWTRKTRFIPAISQQ